MKVTTKTDIGLVRQSNQDACNGGILPDGAAWAVVCDGMGGANGGNIASEIAVNTISQSIRAGYQSNFTIESIKYLLLNAVRSANLAIYEEAKLKEDLRGMGTTAVAVIVREDLVQIVHAGDSRAYLIWTDQIQQLTVDHSMVQEMVNRGDISELEAKHHPQKNIITRALGVQDTIEIDYCEQALLQDSIVLLCSDGLTNYMETDQIYRLSKIQKGAPFAEGLISLAKEGGGGDNITVAIVEH